MADQPHVLVLGDSLTFHGPERAELLTEPRLWPLVASAGIGGRAEVVARAGWTSRDGWWAVAKDPRVWTILADPATVGLVLAVGAMDPMPSSVPVWLRESIPYVRPGAVRRRVRAGYLAVHPRAVAWTGGRWRQLPARATAHYWRRSIEAVRVHRPELPIVLVGPSPTRSKAYPATPHHAAAVAAAQAFAAALGLAFVDVDPLVRPMLERGSGNPDGLHWDWPTHAAVGAAVAAVLAPLVAPPDRGRGR